MKLNEKLLKTAPLFVAAISISVFSLGAKDINADDTDDVSVPEETSLEQVIESEDGNDEEQITLTSDEEVGTFVEVREDLSDKNELPNNQEGNKEENKEENKDENKNDDEENKDGEEGNITPSPSPEVSPSVTPEVQDPDDSETKPEDSDIRRFVERLYSTCLDRGSDVEGINYWSKTLEEHTNTGAAVAANFVFSEEYIGKNTSDEEFLKMLYYAFFDREPDEEGMNYWMFQMNNSGCSRKKIFENFVNSQEFYDICDNFGIVRGYYESDDPNDALPENALMTTEEFEIFNFVERLYGKCLNRGSDSEGIRFWTRLLSSKSKTGAQVSYEFVFSEEYLNLNTTDEEFLKMLYYTFFGREPDEEGFNYWLDTLQNTLRTRKYIFQCFVNSNEYEEICKKYGIDRGSYFSDDPCDQYIEIANFVTRLYKDVLNREPEKEGIDYWTLNLGTFVMTPKEVANRFFDSEEFKDKDTNNIEYVDVLYRTCMGREGEPEGKKYWLDGLEEEKFNRNFVLSYFLECPEFQEIMKTSGIVEKPIVTVARQQVGQEGGAPYLKWYGYNYRIEWCAVFVSWCANQCGYIESGIVPKYKWCMDAKEWFQERGRWVNDNTYRPKSGDIIFYDWNGNGVIDHTGIVVGTDATGRIHTIEGNTKDKVRDDRVIYVGDVDICGYGIPAY